ncbi:MAG: hypothetical protein FWD57_17195, partial [Polyangiaceae bacterium]|nr:hypothetical protein [Polyangiaceae bacterium]
ASDTERDEDDVSTSAPSRIPHKPIAQRFTAERSENSVLFTIDAIMGAANKSGKKPPSPIEPADKIDFGAIATSLPPPPDDGGGFDSSIDAGQSFGAPAYASLSAPMLPTSIEPPPPERESSVGAQTKPNKGLVIGLVAAVAALTIVGGALAYMMMSKDTANTVAAVTAEPTQPAVVEKPVDKIEDKPAVEPATEPTVDVKAEDDKDKVAANADDKAKENSDGEPPDPDGRDNSPEARAAWAKYQKSQGSDKGDPGSKTDGKTEPKPDTAGDAKKPPPSDEPKATAPVAPPPKTDDAPPPPKPAAASGPGPFDRPAAIAALNAAAGQAAGCKKPGGPVGQGRVSVTFATSGNVANVALAGELAGTSADSCIKSRFRAAKVPPFTGSPVTLPKTISIN